MIPEPTKGVKSIKRSMKGNGNDEIVNNPVQETEERTKLKKPASRKSINTTDPSEGTHQGMGPMMTYWEFRYSLSICR